MFFVLKAGAIDNHKKVYIIFLSVKPGAMVIKKDISFPGVESMRAQETA